MKKLTRLTLKDFAEMMGEKQDLMPKECSDLISSFCFEYQELESHEIDQVTSEILEKINNSGHRSRAGWKEFWSKHLEQFVKSNYSIDQITPAFLNLKRVIRFRGTYIMPSDDKFELNFMALVRYYLFNKYLKNIDSIYEFGCGSGLNLIGLHKLFPRKTMHGLDWTEECKEIVDLIAKKHSYNISSHVFDMLSPDYDLNIPPRSAFLTVDGLEGLGTEFEPFLEFVLDKNPGICINIEPLIELYDNTGSNDDLAIEFHQRRGYLKGFVPRLQNLKNQRKIEILEQRRILFGSKYHEGYSFIIWKPTSRSGGNR